MSLLFFTLFLTCHLTSGLNQATPLPSISSGYRFDSPHERIFLPDVLKEVSGVTVIDRNTLAFIQDEFPNKAEGMAFLPDGNMLVTNEGEKGKPTLVLLKKKGTQ